jgi:hypothetical protein
VTLATLDQTLLAAWDELGLSDEERKSELDRLNGLLQQVQSEQIESVRQEHLTLKAKIDETRDRHITLLVSLGDEGAAEAIANVKTLGRTGTLRARLAEVQTALDAVYPRYEERLREFESLWSRIEDLTAKLEIADPERADLLNFNRNSLSQADQETLTKQVQRLEEEVAARSDRFRGLSEKIRATAKELNEAIEPEFSEFLDSVPVSPSAYDKADRYFTSLSELKHRRVLDVAQCALELTHCWELLRTDEAERRRFIESHSTLSEEAIAEFRLEIERLRIALTEKLPELVRIVKDEIRRLCDALRQTPPETERVLELEAADVETFRALDAELIRMKQRFIVCQPILELIQRREEIVREFDEVTADRVADRIQREKIIKRHKSMLPRIEKKLLIRLTEFRQLNGEDFMWGGSVLADELAHIQVTATELHRGRKQTRPMPKR